MSFFSTSQATSRGRRVLTASAAVRPGSVTTSFAEYHAANPHIYREFETRALALLAAGATRIAVAKIREEIRADMAVRTLSAEYKLSNTFTPDYARMLVANNPALAKVIELKSRKAVA
jgi:hypothetical protein